MLEEAKYTDWHTYWSYLKSVIRIIACFAGIMGSLRWFAVGMAVAELVGIIEELG